MINHMAEVRYDVHKALCVRSWPLRTFSINQPPLQKYIKRTVSREKLNYLVKIDPKCNILVNNGIRSTPPFLFFRKKREIRKVEREKMNGKKRKAQIRNSLCQIHCL